MKIEKKVIGIGLLAIVFIIVGYYLLSTGTQKQNEYKTSSMNIIYSALAKQKNITDITLHIQKVHSVGPFTLNSTEILIKKETTTGYNYYSNYSMKNINIEYYQFANGTYYICFNRLGMNETKCVDVTISPTLVRDVKEEFKQLPTKLKVSQSEDYFDTLFNTSAYEIIGTDNRTINGRDAECIKLKIKFNEIPPEKLIKMGLSPSDQFVLTSKNYSQEICYDKNTGYPIFSHISYEMGGKKYVYENIVTEITLSAEIPPLENHKGTLDDIIFFRRDFGRLMVCAYLDKRDECLKNEAYEDNNPMFCEFILDEMRRKACLYYFSSYVVDPRLCYEFSGRAKDDCYEQMAKENLAVEMCKYILNESRRDDCVYYVTTTVQKIEEEKLANAECFTDADCHVTGGLNQFCEPINITRNDTEYYHVFECLPPHKNITSCKCIDYKCQWEWTPEYEECYNKMEQLDTREFIEQIIKNKSKEGSEDKNQTNLENQTETESQSEYCIKKGTNYSMSYEEARRIALSSECVENATLSDVYTCNNITGTWWIDLNMTEKKEGCHPACVVFVENKTAEINWRCTGLK